MDRLKALLADRILDLTASNNDDVRMKLDKIQRFRDFANACQSLMIKYPQIEEELIKMVKDGDFDTKIASSRVDSVIRMADKENHLAPQMNDEDEPAEIDIPLIQDDEIEFEVVQPADDEMDSVTSIGGDIDEIIISNPSTTEIETDLNEQELAAAKRKRTIRMVLQIAGIIIGVALLIIIIKFVMSNWQTILIVLGVALLILILVWFLRRKRN